MILQWVAENFQKSQYLILGAVLIAAWMGLRSRSPQSQFKSREADRSDLNRLRGGEDLANAKLNKPAPAKPKAPPLHLPGIRLHGEPHEVLGIQANASEAEVMKAYKDAIKQYHPDRIQGQAQEQIKFYQEASSQLNQAKEAMIQKIRNRS